MHATTLTPSRPWPSDDTARVPAWIYSDPNVFAREMERFFFGPMWSYVGLECELPSPGSFKRSWVGTRPVVVTRDADGVINVLENRCAHRGTLVCWETRGVAKSLTCPYHQWTYDLTGELQGMPFMRGMKGDGGMSADFDRKQHGLRRLRVETRGGAIWATYDDDAPDFATYCGEEILALYDRTFNGRPLELIGYTRQLLPANWKVYSENLRDPYHATILHSFFVTFGLFRADGEFFFNSTCNGRHELVKSTFAPRTAESDTVMRKDLSNVRAGLRLQDMSVVTPIDEYNDRTMVNFHLFPSALFQQHANILTMRQIVPKSVGSMELLWTQFGYADDTPAMRETRLKQANLVGPAGLVSVEDGEVLAVLHQNVQQYPDSVQVLELGGRDINLPQRTMVQEDLLRDFYRFYRRVMEY